MKKGLLLLLITASFASRLFAIDYFNTYPTHWWVGMKNPKLQLILHGENIGLASTVSINYPGVKIEKVNKVENKNYIFLDIVIAPNTKAGVFKIIVSGKEIGTDDIFYELKSRSKENGKTRIKGVDASDLVYLLMPDRFSNGDPTNDYFADMLDTGHDRNNPFDRHGGDLKGVQNHLDYLKELGVTTIWMMPVLENNMSRTLEAGTSRSTYHGYAITNHFEVDKRLGGNDAYKKLADAAHANGLKIIEDAVYNHVGNDHWSVKDMPMKDWLNQWPSYQNTSYRDYPIIDPHGSAIDKKISLDGWFTSFLVDLNQRNPYVAKYLTQYMIWNTEEFGVDGWRVDTYFYNEPKFLNDLNNALFNEYPQLGYFGETLVGDPTVAAYFSQNNMVVPFKHNSPGVTDFPLTLALQDCFKQQPGWNDGVNRVHQTLANDFLYKNPNRNCIFLDNHDMDRIFSVIGEDVSKMKAAFNLLLTLRGIPQLYYGSEILMKNFKDPTDAEVRKDFPGGWAGDALNKFTAAGRTAEENDMFNHVKALANFRKKSPAITSGNLMQYLPKDGAYVYFRYTSKQTVMVILNTGTADYKPDWNYLSERAAGFTKLQNAVTKEIIPMAGFEIKPKESFVFELLK
jgi:neopullulanase